MTSEHVPPTARSGLPLVLGATAVAGIVGYAIQAIVPAFTSVPDYLSFSIFWSAVYLVVSAVSGVQQEIARSARPKRMLEAGWPTLWWFIAIAAVGTSVLVGLTLPLWSGTAFGAAAATLAPPLIFATAAYAVVAGLSGAYYGMRNWRAVAGMTVSDASLRFVTIGIALAFGGHLLHLSWAIAIPFAAASVLMWLLTRKGLRDGIELDSSLLILLSHGVSTVGAALATGVMISGLPLLLGASSTSIGATPLAAMILVITLTRAPLVIPILALQSYLVVTFRDDSARTRARLLLWGGALSLLTGVLAAAGAAVGPWLIDWIYAGRYELPSVVYAAIIGSAGATALLCLTGPACLATHRHGWYVGGWATASGILVVGIALMRPDMVTVLCLLIASPLVGVAIHAIGLTRRARQSRG